MFIKNDDKLNEHVAYTLLWLRAKRTRNGFKSSSLQETDRAKRTTVQRSTVASHTSERL